MAAALVQQATGFTSFGPTMTAALTGVAAGNLLVVVIREGYGNPSFAVSDSVNGAYTAAVQNGDTSSGKAAIFYFANAAAGSPTVTVTFGADSTGDLNFSEWSGVSTGAVDATNTADNASGTSHSSGSVTPSASALMITAHALSGTHGGATVASGYTALATFGGAARQHYQYKISHTGASTATWTSTSAVSSKGCHAAFLESGGGGGLTWLPQSHVAGAARDRAVASGFTPPESAQ